MGNWAMASWLYDSCLEVGIPKSDLERVVTTWPKIDRTDHSLTREDIMGPHTD